MADLYVPNYMSFHNNNIYLGSQGKLRFKLSPNLEEDVIRAEYWYGPLCYEMSRMDGEETFPLTDEGIADMTRWLDQLAQNPPET